MLEYADGEYHNNVRWCKRRARDHGPLYPCEHYPQSVKDDIERQNIEFRDNHSDPVKIKKMLDDGLSQEAIFIGQ